jgi:hypothetical protein
MKYDGFTPTGPGGFKLQAIIESFEAQGGKISGLGFSDDAKTATFKVSAEIVSHPNIWLEDSVKLVHSKVVNTSTYEIDLSN